MPRGNGQVERIHRIIISILTKLCIEKPDLWYRHVSRVQRSINSTFQRSINCTPYELMVGNRMRIKEDMEIYNLLKQEGRDIYFQEREDMRQKAKEQIFQIQEENRRSYNKKRKEAKKYIKGDLVAIKRTQYGSGMKLKPKFLGPYKVTKVMGNDRYQVRKVSSVTEGPNNTFSSVDFMKKWPAVLSD